ncbi:hypothetical protein Acid345_3692 [Candidatus Koribacter versatilis Ellin345]|uniref:Outer membrane protein beta-barrel domain-containing protein n=1 Tax=Koribacter versatilis (strain Ellin345) TaxID=204669 RepID=Q1IKA7_KORVE|nr:hypothetical protein [Candidatus Koribacter versatilis]ABF42693.1 hypothetical protein Acid345_3692 [Candidatus Koribacter versatilis Ellin345]
MRKSLWLLVLLAFFSVPHLMHAQQLDAGFGVFTLVAPSNTTLTSTSFTPQSIGGGAFPAVSANYLWKNHLGIQGEVTWRASDNVYGGYQPFRPILYDFNAMYAPYLGKHVELELLGGIGGQSSRFYNAYYQCTFYGCSDYSSSNHFLGHVGGGIRFYVWHRVFVRPEAHAYFVHNNWEFNSGQSQRYGVSIGYSFGSSD